ncbi:MAG: 50S ribosomal protein L23 [Candidatus Saccharibacteria bacterium]
MNIYPRKTEKAYGQSLNNIYVFDVPTSANKQQILAAVASQFNVKPINIKTLVQSGKAIRVSRGKRAHPGVTTRRDLKKAYVTLAAGDSIKVFDEVAAEPETKATKKEKK